MLSTTTIVRALSWTLEISSWPKIVKFMYFEKATVDLTSITYNKSTVEILKKNVAFSEYMNFKYFYSTT